MRKFSGNQVRLYGTTFDGQYRSAAADAGAHGVAVPVACLLLANSPRGQLLFFVFRVVFPFEVSMTYPTERIKIVGRSYIIGG
ncbi:hypothetical protein L6452_35129 [Arctium lappa]|uniref:Uncharacterized protein n=1 Tax=Arctium lappa TaxID=4217 RepID=A0ACB8YKQ6_ARCLA|nr:hypothetical protein L6452_35129 [Arctium lappa]